MRVKSSGMSGHDLKLIPALFIFVYICDVRYAYRIYTAKVTNFEVRRDLIHRMIKGIITTIMKSCSYYANIQIITVYPSVIHRSFSTLAYHLGRIRTEPYATQD